MKSKAYVISVSLYKGCYRHIKISGGATLCELSSAILDAFEFDDDHAHAFFMNNKKWDDSESYFSSEIEDEERFTDKFTLDKLSLQEGRQFKYLFDFGDEWTFQCKVLHILDEKVELPIVIRTVGEAPSQYEAMDGEGINNHDAPEELDKLYEKYGLSREKADTLRDYFFALSFLYDIIPLSKAYEIISADMDEPLDIEQFNGFADIYKYNQSNHYLSVVPGNELFDEDEIPEYNEKFIVIEYLLIYEDDDEFYYIFEMQRNKPYYIPPKGELLNYKDEGYFTQTHETEAMERFLKRVYNKSDEFIRETLETIIIMSKIPDMKIGEIIDELERMKLSMTEKRLTEFMPLYLNLYNNTRMPVNRGYTPNELFKINMPEKPVAAQVKKRKIGANEPCPCGSGIKFKKCCRGKGIYD